MCFDTSFQLVVLLLVLVITLNLAGDSLLSGNKITRIVCSSWVFNIPHIEEFCDHCQYHTYEKNFRIFVVSVNAHMPPKYMRIPYVSDLLFNEERHWRDPIRRPGEELRTLYGGHWWYKWQQGTGMPITRIVIELKQFGIRFHSWVHATWKEQTIDIILAYVDR